LKFDIYSYWIPASAGMTRGGTGMTRGVTGMTRGGNMGMIRAICLPISFPQFLNLMFF